MKLRTAAVLALLFASIASPSFAQRMVSGGVKGGLNMATISLDPDDEDFDLKMKAGLAVGGFVEVGINDMLAFQPEFLFSMKGAKAEEFGETAKFNINVVEIPLLLRANFQTSGQATPFIVVGPGVSFKTSAKIKVEGQPDEDIDDIKSTDFGVIFGGGVAVGRATIEARYDLGLSDLDDSDGKAKSRTFSVLVGYGFGK